MTSNRWIPLSLVSLLLLLFVYLLVRFRSFLVALEVSVVIGLLALAAMYVLSRTSNPKIEASDPIDLTLSESKRLIDDAQDYINQLCHQQGESGENCQRLRRVHALMISTLDAFNDADKRDLAPAYLEQFVKPAHRWLEEYARLSTRGVAHADRDLKEAADRIPDVERSFISLYEQIHTSDVTNLALLNLEIGSGLLLQPPKNEPGR